MRITTDRQECVLWREFLLLSSFESHTPGRLDQSVSLAQMLVCACVCVCISV